MINKLNKFAIALMVAGATATATTALARTTNTFTNAVQTLTIDLKLYTNSSTGKGNKAITFTTKNLISALSNDMANLPTLSGSNSAFTKNPTIVVSTTYGAALVPVATNAVSTNSMTNSVVSTNAAFVAVPVATVNIVLSPTNAGAIMFGATSDLFPTNTTNTELIIGSSSNGAVITNEIVVVTNITTNSYTSGGVTNYLTNTTETVATNLVLIATNGWTTNAAGTNGNIILTNLVYYVGSTNTNGAANFLTNSGTNFGTNFTTFVTNTNAFVLISSSLITNTITNTTLGVTNTNVVLTNLTFLTETNSTNFVTTTNTNLVVTFQTNFVTNFTTNVTVTDVGLEVQGGPSTNYSYASLDSLLSMSNIQSVLISSNATSSVEYQYDKFGIGVFNTNSTNIVSLNLHGFVQLTSKDDVLSTSHGTKTEVPDDTYTATVTGYGYIGGTYSTNAVVATNSSSFALPGTNTSVGTNGSVVGATPVVVEGTISLGAPKNIGER